MAQVRDHSATYARRNERAIAAGFKSYGAQRSARRFGSTGQATPGSRPTGARRIHDAVGYDQDFAQDWEVSDFASTRVDRARYSPSRRELQVFWTNAPPGTPYPPYIYDAVDPATWTNFMLSGSPGSYVNTTLNRFPFRPAPDVIGEF